MYYCLVYFPKKETYGINKIRIKYDRNYNLIEPHLTILFPVPSSVGEKRIIKHIENVLKERPPIKIRFCGFKKSWDHWLFLTLKEGENEIKKLYVELYSGFLSEYRRYDIEFIPHIGLGLFVKGDSKYDPKNPSALTLDEKTYKQALSEVELMDLDFQCTVDNLDLIELDDDFTSIKTVSKFLLK